MARNLIKETKPRKLGEGEAPANEGLQQLIDERIQWFYASRMSLDMVQPGSIDHRAITNVRVINPRELPAVASHGDVARVAVNLAAGFLWTFVYNAEHDGEHRWFFSGGSPLIDHVAALENTSSVSYTDLATVGPSCDTPLSGVYRVGVEATIFIDTATELALMSPHVVGSIPSDGDGIRHGSTAGHQASVSRAYSSYLTTTDDASEIRARYRVSAGNGYFFYRSLIVTPVRVKGTA